MDSEGEDQIVQRHARRKLRRAAVASDDEESGI